MKGMDETSGLPRAGVAHSWYIVDRSTDASRGVVGICRIVAMATCPERHLLPRSLSLCVSGSSRITGFPAVHYHRVAHQTTEGRRSTRGAPRRPCLSIAVSCIGEKSCAYQSDEATTLAERRGPTEACLVCARIVAFNMDGKLFLGC